MTYSLFTDGGSRGNPGEAAAAAILLDQEGNLVEAFSSYLGKATNNYAEYKGLLFGLDLAARNNISDLIVHMDSELIIMQVNGAYRVKHPDLKPLFEQVKEFKSKFKNIKFVHVRREKNQAADKMVNETLDAQVSV